MISLVWMQGTFRYVYILQSKSDESAFYVGPTENLSARLVKHNAGQSPTGASLNFWAFVSVCAD